MKPRKVMKPWASIFLTITLSTFTQSASAEIIRVAVASNFSATLLELASQFEKESGHTVKLSSASTGKLYAQITHGAPFDIFFSADALRPELLAQQLAKQTNRQQAKNDSNGDAKTYAYGRLVFLAYREDKPTNDNTGNNKKTCTQQLSASSVKRVAIANPVTAPYGLAAKQTLESLGLWEEVEDKMVMGENISQTLHFIDSQNAQAGFVAKSQLIKHNIKNTCQWDVPEQHHAKIEQKMLKLKPHKKYPVTDAFWDFMSSPQAFTIIKANGYHVPDEDKK